MGSSSKSADHPPAPKVPATKVPPANPKPSDPKPSGASNPAPVKMASDPKSVSRLDRFRDPLGDIEVVGRGLQLRMLDEYTEEQRNFLRSIPDWAY